jgi:hypothetical protein
MESAPINILIEKDDESYFQNITINEYEDDKLIKSFEYYDNTKSTEGGSVMSKPQLHEYGINIILHSKEHGQMDKTRVLKDEESPAHAIVLIAFTSNKIGELNMTGPCPKTIRDVIEYRANRNKNSQLFNNHRKNIIRWANDKTVIVDKEISN